jgi:small GTP-binding protein
MLRIECKRGTATCGASALKLQFRLVVSLGSPVSEVQISKTRTGRNSLVYDVRMTGKNVKVVLVGSTSVGKTCIIHRSTTGTFTAGSSPTLGTAFASQDVVVNGVAVNLLIWDTAGQERYRSIADVYYRDATAALIVYSIGERDTYTDVDGWLRRISDNAPDNVLLFLVGNKSDLEADRVVSFDEGNQKATAIGASFFEVSALNGYGIENLFSSVAAQALDAADAPTGPQIKALDGQEEDGRSSGCC